MKWGYKLIISLSIILVIIAVSAYLLTNRSKSTVTQSTVLTEGTSDLNKDMKIPILMFHHIDSSIPKGLDSTIITPDEFNETLLKIKEDGYTPISIKELNDIYYNKDTRITKPIVITFDDGYESNYEYAFPLLKKYGMKANIFVITSSVGKKPGLFSHFTWDQAKEMENSGLVRIYNHTTLHKTADESTNDEFLESVREAQIDLDKNLGKRDIKAFAYPEGRYNDYLVAKLKEDGYKFQFTVNKGQNSLADDTGRLKRFNVPHFDDGRNIITMIN